MHINDVEIGKYYIFKFRGMLPIPDVRAKVLEIDEGEEKIKVDVDGIIVIWNVYSLDKAVPVVVGGRRRKASRKIRKVHRKGSHKSYRKGSRKSRRTCRK